MVVQTREANVDFNDLFSLVSHNELVAARLLAALPFVLV